MGMKMNVTTIALCDLRLILRNKPMFALLLLTPILMIALLGYALNPVFSPDKTINPFPVLYLNQDQGATGLSFDEFLHNQQLLELIAVDAQGLEAELTTGNYPAAIKVPENFSLNLSRGEKSNIEIILTGQDQVQEEITRSIVKSFVDSYNTEIGISSSLTAMDSAAQDFVTLKETGITSQLSSYQYFAASMLIFFLITTGMGVATSLVQDRIDKISTRIHSFPVTKGQYLLGKVISNGLIALVQAATVILFARFIFHVDWGSSPIGLTLTILTVIFVSSALGIVLSSLLDSTKAVTAVLTVLSWFMAFFSGGFTGAPVLGSVGDFTLNKWAFDALANLMSGKGVAEITVYLLPLLTASLILWPIGIFMYKRRFSYE